jgi:signal transduction histidine kinase
MPVEYERLLAGLAAVDSMIASDRGGLPAIRVLTQTAQEACGAAGATFTEYRRDGGRVVAATGLMDWSLGQPVGNELIESSAAPHAWSGPIDVMPVLVAEPLLSRGLRFMAGYAGQIGGRVLGALHVYFTDASMDFGPQELALLGLAARAAVQLFHAAIPVLPADSADDRELFLAITGHELRTPVTVIKGYATMLADRWDDLAESDRREAANAMAQRSGELARLVDRLLSASSGSQAIGLTLRAVPFDLRENLLRAVSELPTRLRRAVRVELPNRLPPVYGDPAGFASILGELVANGVKYSQPSSQSPFGPAESVEPPTVEIQAGADEQTIFVDVCDRGIGIDPANVERAFERFWQAGNGDKGARGGVGLGLHLVRRLVERQNGWVSLRPREGGGTVARVRLPRADGPLRPPRPDL